MSLKDELTQLADKRTVVPVPAELNPLQSPLFVLKLKNFEAQDWITESMVHNKLATVGQSLQIDPKEVPRRIAKLLVRVLCDADGKRVFDNSDWPIVDRIDSCVTVALFNFVVDLNQLNDSDEDIEKN